MKKGKLKARIKSFGAQMALFYLAAGLAIIVLFSGIVYTVTSDIFIKEAVAKTQMAMESGANGIGDYIRSAKSLLQVYAENTQAIDFAKSGATDAPQNVLDQMTAIRESNANVFEVFILLPNGNTITSRNGNTTSDFNDINTDAPCLTSERADNYTHNDPWSLTIGVPVASKSGEQYGVLGMDLDYCLFKRTVSGFDMGDKGNIAILNDAGELVFHTDTTVLSLANKDADFYKQAQSGYDAGVNMLTHSVAIPHTGWTMVGTASLDGLNELQRQMLDMVVLTGALLFLALLAITATVSKKLTTPLARLAASMEDIQSLAELRVNTNEISEAVTLTHSYNHMIKRIKQLMHELENKQGEIRKHELDVLTSQINPHFLYNTLDTIVWLAEFRDNDSIISLTKSLAAFFRLSLNGGQAVVSLRDEIDHVKQYLFIQKVRYDDKLTYSFEVDDATLTWRVPKIILQPIVENAIYHGIKPMEGIGHIIIKAYINGEDLVLNVTDNGVGYDTQSTICKSIKKGGGVGLCNVERRIKLYYGEEAFINVISSPNKGTAVTLTLKAQPIKHTDKA